MKKNIKFLSSVIISLLFSTFYQHQNALYASKIIDASDLNVHTQNIDNTKNYQNNFKPREDDIFGNGTKKYPIYQVEISKNDAYRKNKISLTFDSAYINDYTYKILDILDEYNAKCTFFMTAEWASENPTHVQEIYKRGHEIGNHSTYHPNFTNQSDQRIIDEVTNCHNIIKNILNGVDMCLFRCPYGAYDDRTINLITSLGYYPIQWSFDSLDWKNEGKEILFNRFLTTNKLIPGSIILCHNGATYTSDCLKNILELFKLKGLECVKVSDLIYHHNFTISSAGTQKHNVDTNGNFIGDDSERP